MDDIRNKISPTHPVFGGWRKLSNADTLMAGDQTACVSCLLSLKGDIWTDILEEDIGVLVQYGLPGDADIDERVFRRRPLLEIDNHQKFLQYAKSVLKCYEDSLVGTENEYGERECRNQLT